MDKKSSATRVREIVTSITMRDVLGFQTPMREVQHVFLWNLL